MKKPGIIFVSGLIYVLASTSFALQDKPREILKRIPVPVTVNVLNQYWVTTISICNTTPNPISLTDIELNFNYSIPMPTNIWGQPWAAWRVASQQGSNVVLLGGSQNTLEPDPRCKTPLTIQFNAAPDAPLPVGPFVFLAAGVTPPNTSGNLIINMPLAPEAGLSTPQVTVAGMGQTVKQAVNWGTPWQLTNLAAGMYTVTSSPVHNEINSYQAAPINASISAQETTQVEVIYTPNPQLGSYGNGTWVYDSTYDSSGRKTGNRPGLFSEEINQYNDKAGKGHQITQIFSYGGDMEMSCKGSGDASSTTPCTAGNMKVYYKPEATAAYLQAAGETANPVTMYPVVDGVVGGPYLTTFNSLTQEEASIYADNVASLYCADDNVAGVAFDLEPFDINQPGQAYFFAQIAKNFAGQHNGAAQDDPYHCVNVTHPKGRTFSVFTNASHVNNTLAAIFNQYGNGYVIDSLYDLGPDSGGVANSISNYKKYVRAEVIKMMANAKRYNVKYQLAIPAAASVHEFETVNGQSTGFKQLDYVKAAMQAINDNNVRQDPLFLGIDLWAWNQMMIWSGKIFTPSLPNEAILNYLASSL